jgi:hypothetical protein
MKIAFFIVILKLCFYPITEASVGSVWGAITFLILHFHWSGTFENSMLHQNLLIHFRFFKNWYIAHITSFYGYFIHHWEGNTIICWQKNNLFISSRFDPKLLAETNDHEILIFVFFINRFEIFILWCQSTFWSCIYDHYFLPFQCGEIKCLPW